MLLLKPGFGGGDFETDCLSVGIFTKNLSTKVRIAPR